MPSASRACRKLRREKKISKIHEQNHVNQPSTELKQETFRHDLVLHIAKFIFEKPPAPKQQIRSIADITQITGSRLLVWKAFKKYVLFCIWIVIDSFVSYSLGNSMILSKKFKCDFTLIGVYEQIKSRLDFFAFLEYSGEESRLLWIGKEIHRLMLPSIYAWENSKSFEDSEFSQNSNKVFRSIDSIFINRYYWELLEKELPGLYHSALILLKKESNLMYFDEYNPDKPGIPLIDKFISKNRPWVQRTRWVRRTR